MFFSRRRRSASPPEPASGTPAPLRPAPGPATLRAPSPLHAFNRYELKYLVPEDRLPEVRRTLETRMDGDPHARHGGYDVLSLYYDSGSLRFYWEKIDGLRFRRKVRLRVYGDRSEIHDDTPVFLEVKQRVNRVTQKRRVQIPYGAARQLCDEREMIDHEPGQRAFLEEVLALVVENDLRPIVTTSYQREPFVGHDTDLGLRVTLDHRIRGRDRDFHLGADSQDRFTISPHLAVMEIKVNERAPYWITDMAAALDLSVVRVSKYCQSVETFGMAPRSVFHVPDDIDDTYPAGHPIPARAPGHQHEEFPAR